MVVHLTDLILTSCTISSWGCMKSSCNDKADTLIEDLLRATHLTMSGVEDDSDLALKKEVAGWSVRQPCRWIEFRDDLRIQ